MPLTEIGCRNAKHSNRPKKVSDGGGLFLLLQPSGSKLWRLAYRYNGKQKTLALGKYPIVSLKEARRKRDEAKSLLLENIDPSAHKKKLAETKADTQATTFEAVGREWFSVRREGWTAGYADRLLRRIEGDLFEELGHRPISEIEPPELT